MILKYEYLKCLPNNVYRQEKQLILKSKHSLLRSEYSKE